MAIAENTGMHDMVQKRLEIGESYKIVVLGFLLAFCLLITYYFHFILNIGIFFTHLFYVPLLLACLWWPRKGIVVAVFLAVVLLVSHILSPLEVPIWSDVTRAFMFVIIGLVVAYLSVTRQILEENLRAYSKTLEQRVEDRTSELREIEEKQRAILDGIGDVVIVLDGDLNITWANEIALKEYGTIIGRKCYEVYKWLKEPCSDCIARATYANGVAMTVEEEGILRDGSHVNFIVSCSPVRNAKGVVVSVVAVLHDITKRKKAEEQVKASLKEKEVLLMEIHHRVENNLQILSSLLDLSSMQTHDPEAIALFTDARATIHTMALIHSQLYQSDRFDQIDMACHIRELIGFLSQIYASDLITPIIDCSDVYLSITQAIPCALVTNELVSNAYKHAFAKGQKGTIDISMRLSAEDTIFFRVKDDGIGIPDEVDIYKTDSLGLKLVTNLVQQQLKGEIQVIRDNGTEFIIEFKIVKEEAVKYA